MTSQMDRRDFVKTVAVSAGTAVAQHLLSPMLSAGTTPSNNGMIYRTLGRTGERVSLVGLGGWHIGPPSVPERDSLQLIRQAIDRGINFLDNCQSYNAGESESRMGKALQDGYREKVFLMTKIDGRTKEEANRQIDRCLSRLRTDRIDLLQFHEVIRLEDPDRIFAGGGAMEAMLAAQRAGKVRYIGFTGHKDPFVHLRMLDVARNSNFRFDTVQMPLNVMDAHDFRSFTKQVLPVLNREGIAPLGMKAFGDHAILDGKTVTPIEALQFCFNLPIAVQITGIDSQKILDQALEASVHSSRSRRPKSRTSRSAPACLLPMANTNCTRPPPTLMEPNNIRNGWDKKLLEDRWNKDVAHRAGWLHMFRVNAICPGYIGTPSSTRKSIRSPLRRSWRRQKTRSL